ncbi:MAG: copper homeostasis protein CutC [Gemmatimonadetes bacterium]|nr:copper homeostasis protein CutC [Gemmatimonadota bacterium]
MSVLVEAAVESFGRARAAQDGGCKRIELCGSLHDGGVTPSAGLIARCSQKLITSVHVLIRPRTGSFVYDEEDVGIMMKDILVAKELDADGVMIGALTPEGEVDVAVVSELMAVATPMKVGFHRAFDEIKDQEMALELLVSLQLDSILTTGGAKTAVEGTAQLRRLVERAHDRITIIGAGSVTSANAAELVRATGLRELHASKFEGIEAAVNR